MSKLANVSNVSDDVKNLASFLEAVLNRVENVYNSYDMPLPSRRYWALSVAPVDCEQLVVSFLQMYIGAPGAEATEASRCSDPRSATLHISVSRAVPMAQQNGHPPTSQSIENAATVGAYDAWILMESVNELDVWGDHPGFGLGVIATVDVDPPEGGFQTVKMVITMAVP